MADRLPSQQQINEAKAAEDEAKKQWENYVLPPNPTSAEYNKKDSLEKKWKEAKKVREVLEKPVKAVEKNLARVQKSIKQATEAAKNPASKAAADKQLIALRQEETSLKETLGTSTGETPVATTTTTTAPTGPMPTTGRSGRTTPVPVGTTGPTTPAKPTKPTGTGGKKTTTGTAKTTGTATVGGKKVTVGGSQWQTIIQEEFGSLWDVYNDNADVHKVIDKSVAEGWYNDNAKLTAALQNTNWFRATQSSARQFKIRQSTDPASTEAEINQSLETIRAKALNTGVVLPDTSLRMLAENSLKFGWKTEAEFSNAIGSEAVAVAKTGGAQGMADLNKGATGTNLRMIADNYGIKPTDTMLNQWVAEIMQGTKTDVQFTDLMKQQASAQYRSLAPLIEKGQDVKTATTMYSNSAQNVLGIDPATIDWSQDKWNRALNYQDPKTGEYRQMDSWEWNRYLRQQPEWQNTDDAKSIYRNAAFSLAQAFGKTT